MPRIPDYIADSAIYLYSSDRAAREGENAGGSGFLVNVPAIPGLGHIYAVTNRHLVDGSTDGQFWTIRLTKRVGGIDCITTNKDEWLLHEEGDDVAILPLGLKDGLKWWAVPTDKFLDHEGVQANAIGYGDDVFMVGRLISHSGVQRNTPVARFGTIALSADPAEPIQYRGKKQEAFLVECHSISGFSGSPVFVMTDRVFRDEYLQRVLAWERKKRGTEEPPPNPSGMTITLTMREGGIGPYLLGIDFGHIPMRTPVYRKNRKADYKTDYEVQANTGIAGIVPAWKIMDLLVTPRLAEEREHEDEELKKKLQGLPKTFILDAAKEYQGEEFTQQALEKALRNANRRLDASEAEAERK